MRLRSRRTEVTALALALALLLPAQCLAGGLPAPEALAPSAGLVDRLALDREVRGDLLGFLRLTSQRERLSAGSALARARALDRLGLAGQARDWFSLAVAADDLPEEVRREAAARRLALSRLVREDPPVLFPSRLDGLFRGRSSLLLGSALASRGDTLRGNRLLERASSDAEVEVRVLAAAALAQGRAGQGDPRGALEALGRSRPSQASAYSDLLALVRGYQLLEGGEPVRARESFVSVPPSSPFSAEALFGQAWALLRAGDRTGAALRLAELVEAFPFSGPAMEGAVDLALCYRDLGLHDWALGSLAQQGERIAEFRSWLGSLTPATLAEGGEEMALVRMAAGVQPPDTAILAKAPGYKKRWAERAGTDAEVRRVSSLLAGLPSVEAARRSLGGRAAEAERLLEREIYWTALDLKAVEGIEEAQRGFRRRLPLLGEDLSRAMGDVSLDRYSSQKCLDLLSSIRAFEDRISGMERAVARAGSFSPILEELSASADTAEEKQLQRIRQQAYESLQGSRSAISGLRSDLRMLAGRIWLRLKMGAADRDEERRAAISAAAARLDAQMAASARARDTLAARLDRLRQAARDVRADAERVSARLPAALADLERSLQGARDRRLLALAAEMLSELDLDEARTLHVAADIEVARMEQVLRAMQEAVK